MSKRPYIICHMASSIDGKIDGAALRSVMRAGEYEALHSKLGGNGWLCGRTTMEQHFAESEPFKSKTNTPAGPQPAYVAKRAESYAIAVDTFGKLRWASNDVGGDHLVCILSERVPTDYLAFLREQEISYVVAGQNSVDLNRAMELLSEHFGIRTLLLEGGGHINGGFLQAGLVDEVSLLLLPGIDGRHDIAGVFDGIVAEDRTAVPLKIKSVERREGDALWIRYEVRRA
ncbi:MAG TPA: dihydrofolate reductase family protein [Terriglobales bacterium]|nr:dihydrofolate reductase family protein [Terriglobales bacterium]